jgi:transglutaminase-like putative cysteine protease
LILVLSAALERQGLIRLPAYVATAWLALASITALGSREASRSARRAFGLAGRTALAAIPLAALCFVLVPRMPGALWSMPTSRNAMTGLGDEMSPGSITDLALSEGIAFRVRFSGSAPPEEARYWRGPVLHDFDGSTWRRRPGQFAVWQAPEPLSAPVRYQITLEPHGRRDLFTLDAVEGIEGPPNRQTFDGQVLARRDVTAAVGYSAVSHLRTRYTGTLSTTGRNLDTHLPPGRNPRSVQLARQLQALGGTDADYVRRVLDHFRQIRLEYTLTPPPLGQDSIDELLFNTRQGFCGHFASAYVMLMRAAGIPARVVTGYLGGDWNPVGGFYTVRQSNAHAWAEVWLQGKGWTRVDPTAVVVPGRLEFTPTDRLASRTAEAAEALLGDTSWLQDLGYTWDAAASWWQERVVNFNQAAQRNLLERLGLGNLDYPGMALLLLVAAALWAALLLALSARRVSPPRTDPLGRIWNRYATLLQRRGLAIAAHDGPEAIRRRAQQLLPEAANDIEQFTREYALLRFGAGAHRRLDGRALRPLNARLAGIARSTAARRPPRTAPAARG